MMMNLCLSILALSNTFLKTLLQTTQAPFALPHFIYHHCYMTHGVKPIMIVMSTYIRQSPDYLRAKVDFELTPVNKNNNPSEYAREYDFFKTKKSCESGLEFSTKNRKFENLKIKVRLLLGWNNEIYATFIYEINDKIVFGNLQLVNTHRQVGLLVKISQDGQKYLPDSSKKTKNEVIDSLKGLQSKHNALCLVTKTDKALVVKPNVDMHSEGYATALKAEYTKDQNVIWKKYPAFSCTVDENENKDIFVVTDIGVTMDLISFKILIFLYGNHKQTSVNSFLLNAYLVTFDQLDKKSPLKRLFFIYGSVNNKNCNGGTQVRSYLTSNKETFDAYRSRYSEIQKGAKGLFWENLLTAPFACAA